jgi:hypothetical protein
MFRRVPTFVFWMLLGFTVALIPLACGSDNTGTTNVESPDAMTKG